MAVKWCMVLCKDVEKHKSDVQYHLQFTTEAVNENFTYIHMVVHGMEKLEAKAELQQQMIKRQENALAHFEVS